MAPIFCVVSDLKWRLTLGRGVHVVEGKPPGKQQATSFSDREVVSCPISLDSAEQTKATRMADISDTLLEVPTATGQE